MSAFSITESWRGEESCWGGWYSVLCLSVSVSLAAHQQLTWAVFGIDCTLHWVGERGEEGGLISLFSLLIASFFRQAFFILFLAFDLSTWPCNVCHGHHYHRYVRLLFVGVAVFLALLLLVSLHCLPVLIYGMRVCECLCLCVLLLSA